MEISDSEKAELFRKWDESGVDLETYNNQIKDKVSKIELILEKSKWELENKVAEEGYNAHLAKKRNPSLHLNNELEHQIHELENEKARFEAQILSDNKIHELENEKAMLEAQILSDKEIHKLEKSNIELKSKLSNESQGDLFPQKSKYSQRPPLDNSVTRELQQEKILMKRINLNLKEKLSSVKMENFKLETKAETSTQLNELEKSNIELKTKLDNSSENLQEAKQEKILLAKKADSKEQTSFIMMKKYYMTIAIAGLIIGGFVGAFTLYQDSIDDDYMMLVGEHAKSKYLVQNLRGDTLATWFPWMLAGSQALHVNILDNNLATEERIQVIQNTISSDETVDIDNSLTHKDSEGTTQTYYKGWGGALQIAAQENTELQIPQTFEFSNSKRPIGDITVELSSLSDPDGYSGYTKSVVDRGEILKSHIVIYDVNSISDEQLSIIFMHEFGHALGLAHSSDPDDLMYPVIETNYPYISECMVDAIAGLYDGLKSSEVICQS